MKEKLTKLIETYEKELKRGPDYTDYADGQIDQLKRVIDDLKYLLDHNQ